MDFTLSMLSILEERARNGFIQCVRVNEWTDDALNDEGKTQNLSSLTLQRQVKLQCLRKWRLIFGGTESTRMLVLSLSEEIQ